MTQPAQPIGPHSRPLRGWEWLALAGLVALFAAQALLAAPRKSAAFDEQYHLTAGYSYLRTGDFRLATNHPPLAGMLAALPLLARADIRLPLDDPAWAAADRYRFSDVFLWESNDSGPELLVAARGTMVVLGALLLIALFFWARQMLGVYAGWLALFLATFDPNLIANARLATTDLAVTFFLLATVWWLWRWLQWARLAAIVVAGITAGLAMASKYNALLIWPIVALVILVTPGVRRQLARRLLGLGAMAVVALVTLWAVYAFDFGRVAGWALPLPAPYYWENLVGAYQRIVTGSEAKLSFFLGQVSGDGRWSYFPVALGVKTPLPTLLFFAAGLITVAWRREWRRLCALWLPLLFFFALALTGFLTIGYRHILPALPFLILVGAHSANLPLQVARFGAGWRRALTAAGVLLCSWLLITTLRFFPDHEAYFNELAGPWTHWSDLLVDSNLDWGQDLVALRERMDELGIARVNLAYFGKGVPEAYGVRYHPLPSYLRFVQGKELSAYNPYTPEPGWYAISATSLRLGLMTPATVDLYAYFRALEPAARAGYSIYLYHVAYPETMPADRIPVIGSNVSLLSPADLGITPGRRGQIKWMENEEVAIYPAAEADDRLADETYTPLDGDFAGSFRLVGVRSQPEPVQAGQPLSVTLVWRVGAAPAPMPAPTVGEPLSTFVHLTTADPAQIVAQFDGWRTALRGLEEGDAIVQRMMLSTDAAIAPGDYVLRAGLYSPQSGERLPVQTAGGSGDHVVLGTVRVVPESAPP